MSLALEFDFFPKKEVKPRNPPTSIAAHDSIKDDKEKIYAKIIKGLEELKVGGNFEEVALAAGISPSQSHKRLPELIKMGVVYNVGTTRTTSSGRQSMIRQLVKFKK